MSQTALREVQDVLPRLTSVEKRKLLRRVAVSLRARGVPLEVARQKRALRALQRKLAELPVCCNDDGFSGRDHDKALYGRV